MTDQINVSKIFRFSKEKILIVDFCSMKLIWVQNPSRSPDVKKPLKRGASILEFITQTGAESVAVVFFQELVSFKVEVKPVMFIIHADRKNTAVALNVIGIHLITAQHAGNSGSGRLIRIVELMIPAAAGTQCQIISSIMLNDLRA